MNRGHEANSLFIGAGNLGLFLNEIVDAAIAIAGADFGNIQLLDPQSSQLRIVAQRGFPKWWLDFWNNVCEGQGTCGTALERGERIIVEDVERSPIFIGSPALEIQLKAGIRAVQSTPIMSRSGKFLGMFSTHYKTSRRPEDGALRLLDLLALQAADVIERARAEAELEEREARLRLFIDHAPAALAMFDRDMRYISVSHRWLADYGLSERNVIGMSHYEVFPEIPERWKEFHRRGLAGEIVRSDDDRFDRADGSVQWLRWEIRPWHTAAGEQGGIVIFTEDITERKRAEDALRESEERFRIIAASTPDHLLVQDHDLRYTLVVNPQLGLTEADMLGKTDHDFLPHADADELTKIKRRVLETGQTIHVELPITSRQGELQYFEGTYVPKLNAQGRVDGLIGYFRNVTERKLAEEELKKTVDELARSNKELEQFAYVTSHDLREPLRNIASYVALLEKRYRDSLDEKAREYINYVIHGVKRMKQLIDDLLAYSMISTKDIEFRPTDSSSILKEAIYSLKAAIEESGAVITYDALPMVLADSAQLRSLFQNLIGNSIKYKGKEIPKIHVSAERKQVEWLFSVRDNGIGIDPEYADRIFIVFQRLHTMNEYVGTGIGLAICKRIVEHHGGRIWVESHPGKGSTFFFTIPDKAAIDLQITR